MKLDILAFGAHPDDVELSASGTLIKHIKLGKSVGLIDFTQGELGTRGSGPIRLKEAEESRKIMGAAIRENLRMPDGFFEINEHSLLKVIGAIRAFKPEIVLANALKDRHPDHGRAAELVARAFFLSGLSKVQTFRNEEEQQAWRPKALYHYIQDEQLTPDFVVDISNEFETKMKCILAFKTQFYDKDSTEPVSPISTKSFLDFMDGKNRVFARPIQAEFAEGFNVARVMGVNNLLDLV